MDTEQFFWPFLAKKVAELSKLNSQFHWKLSGESFLQNLQTVIFLNNERKGFGWLSETSQCCFQAAFYLSLGTFEEFSFEKFLLFLWTFFQIISGNWAGMVWPACQNCILRIYKIILKKKLFWKTIEIFHHFQTFGRKISASFRVFRRGCWSCILRVQNNILTKISFFPVFFSLLDTERFFWPILAKKLSELSKVNSQFQWKLSGESFLQNLQTVIFLNNERKGFGWLSEKSQRGFQPAFYLSIGTIWRKLFRKVFASLWTFFRIISSNWAGKVCRPVKTAFFVSTKSFWKKTVLENNWSFSSFSDIGQEDFGFFSKLSSGMLELHFTCPKQHFNEEQFSFSFFFRFWTLSDFFDQFLQKKVAELSKLNPQFPWKLSGESFLQNLQTVIFLNNERKGFGWLCETS